MGHIWQTSDSKAALKRARKGPVSKVKKLNTTEPTEEYMIHQLEKRWGRKVTATCKHCLATAFHESGGYVTDEELIASSGGRLKHK